MSQSDDDRASLTNTKTDKHTTAANLNNKNLLRLGIPENTATTEMDSSISRLRVPRQAELNSLGQVTPAANQGRACTGVDRPPEKRSDEQSKEKGDAIASP